MSRRAPSTPPDLPGYSPVKLLGSGGFADVFLYEQRLPRRKVAVKVLLTEQLNSATRAQFVAEANLMAQLSAHPYIVTIFHADVSGDGRPYFVMEYCSGPSLSERYKRAPFPVEDALRTGIRLASAVATAHAAGILHRDIKPANVLTNDYGWPALTDFGISSNLEGELPVHTTTGVDRDATDSGSDRSAVGMSVPWSPPEMFDDEPRADRRSDVFALAATVHTLLAGRTPFEIPGRSNGSLDLIGRIERGRVTPIGRSDVPRGLEAVLGKGMAVDRAERYPDASEFARALQRIELELGFAATAIEVPNLARHDEVEIAIDEADATRARAPREIVAQQPRPSTDAADAADATVARVAPDATIARAVPTLPADRAAAPRPVVDDGTVVRPRTTPTTSSASAVADQTALRPRTAAATRAAATPAPPELTVRRPRRRLPLVIGAAATLVVAGGIAVAIAASSTIGATPTEPSGSTDTEDAVIAASVPAPTVDPGVRSADGTSVAFAVSHDPAQDGDRYRWTRADGVGAVALADGPEIVVSGVTAQLSVCIDVVVQREDGKTSEEVRACTP